MKRVLVTGASGFVGRHALGDLLARGFEVHALSARSMVEVPGVHAHRVDLLAGDPRDLVARIAPTHLLHLAWVTKPGVYITTPENVEWVEASLRLARAFFATGGTRLVAAGTCMEYDLSTGLCREDSTPRAPNTLYGACKDALREVLEALARAEKRSFAWGRIFHLYGPHEDERRLVAATIRSLLAGKVAKCSDGEQLRDFSHVADVAAAFVALLDSTVEGAVNVASGVGVKVRDVVLTIGNETGRPDLIELGALARRPDEPDAIVADVTRLRERVGFAPRFDLRRGVSDSVCFWRERTRVERSPERH